MQLTRQERECLCAIRSYMDQFGWPPSVADVAMSMGVHSTATAQGYIRRLAEKGYIRVGGKPRQLRICVFPGAASGDTVTGPCSSGMESSQQRGEGRSRFAGKLSG